MDQHLATFGTGFESGFIPVKILGAGTDSSGRMIFKMISKNPRQIKLVAATEANIACPQLVIQFYEQRLVFYWS